MNERKPYSADDLISILNWWENGTTPQKIFGLEDFNNTDTERRQQRTFDAKCPYDADNVEKIFKKLRIKSHPDKFSSETPKNQQNAKKVFTLLEDAKNYLLYTIDLSNPEHQKNVFYDHYYLGWSPNESLKGQLENLVKRIYDRKEKQQDTTEQILAIKGLIEQQPDLIHHTKTKGPYSAQVFEKNIVYCAAEWNEAALMEWLLTRYPSQIATLTETEFGFSPFDIAERKGYVDILKILRDHFPDFYAPYSEEDLTYSEEDLISILKWWENGTTPQKIFGLKDFNNTATERLQQHIFGGKCPYVAYKVEKIFEKLRIKSDPDKFSSETQNKQNAQKVFALLEDAKNYILFTIDLSNPEPQKNVFYDHYYLGWSPKESLEGQLENLVKRIYGLKEKKRDTTEQILAIQGLIEQKPDLIHHTKTKGPYSAQVFKNIVYCAAEWNEAALMQWLLTYDPSKIDTLTETEFGVSPFDIAVREGHVDILKILRDHYGDPWLRHELDRYSRSEEITDFTAILSCYKALFPDFMTRSDKLREAIIGCPFIYTRLDEELRKDPSMMVTFLTQNPRKDWLKRIPLSELDPEFAIALGDRWPLLSDDLESALRVSPAPCNYSKFQGACIGMLIGISLPLFLWHLWPALLLLPGIAQMFSQFFIIFTVSFLSFLVMGSAIDLYSYAVCVYPEARKINAILQKNSFFQPEVLPDNNLVDPAPSNTSHEPNLDSAAQRRHQGLFRTSLRALD